MKWIVANKSCVCPSDGWSQRGVEFQKWRCRWIVCFFARCLFSTDNWRPDVSSPTTWPCRVESCSVSLTGSSHNLFATVIVLEVSFFKSENEEKKVLNERAPEDPRVKKNWCNQLPKWFPLICSTSKVWGRGSLLKTEIKLVWATRDRLEASRKKPSASFSEVFFKKQPETRENFAGGWNCCPSRLSAFPTKKLKEAWNLKIDSEKLAVFDFLKGFFWRDRVRFRSLLVFRFWLVRTRQLSPAAKKSYLPFLLRERKTINE